MVKLTKKSAKIKNEFLEDEHFCLCLIFLFHKSAVKIIRFDCPNAMLLFVQFLALHMVGLFLCYSLTHPILHFLVNHMARLFLRYALIRPISSQSYGWIVPTLCSYSSNFQPMICLYCSYTMLLFVQFLTYHKVGLFPRCILIYSVSNRSQGRIVPTLYSYLFSF